MPEPTRVQGSASRERAGGIDAFNLLRAEVVGEGLAEATSLGIRRGVVTRREALAIRSRYLLSVASVLLQEGSTGVAQNLVDQARELSPEDYQTYRDRYPLHTVTRAG